MIQRDVGAEELEIRLEHSVMALRCEEGRRPAAAPSGSFQPAEDKLTPSS